MPEILKRMGQDVAVWAGELAVFVLVAALVISGRLAPVSAAFLQAEFHLLKRPVSGNVILVEVDRRSAQEMGTWPLPRRSVAKVLGVLKDAGAAAIWIDLDVQPAPVNAEADPLVREMADASDTVVLPPGDNGTADTGLPLERLTQFLQIDQRVPLSPFTVDGTIDHRALPRLSFLDVYDANFNLGAVKGKRVIIAADPSSSGSLLEAAESVLQDRMLHRVPPWSALLLVAATVLFLRPRSRACRLEDVVVPALGAVIGLGSLAALVLQHSTLIVDPVPGFMAATVFVGWMGLVEFARQASHALASHRSNAGRRSIVEAIVDEASDGDGRPRDTSRTKPH